MLEEYKLSRTPRSMDSPSPERNWNKLPDVLRWPKCSETYTLMHFNHVVEVLSGSLFGILKDINTNGDLFLFYFIHSFNDSF